jgi:hypothetical protein
VRAERKRAKRVMLHVKRRFAKYAVNRHARALLAHKSRHHARSWLSPAAKHWVHVLRRSRLTMMVAASLGR